jgi:hypothetical protein
MNDEMCITLMGVTSCHISAHTSAVCCARPLHLQSFPHLSMCDSLNYFLIIACNVKPQGLCRAEMQFLLWQGMTLPHQRTRLRSSRHM